MQNPYETAIALLKLEIAQRQSALADLQDFSRAANKPKQHQPKRRKLSKAARARIADAQRKRWAAQKKAAK